MMEKVYKGTGSTTSRTKGELILKSR